MSAYVVETETMHKALRAILASGVRQFAGEFINQDHARNTDKALTAIGRKLFALNCLAVNGRYPGHDAETPPAYTYQPGGLDKSTATLVANYKALCCLTYQCAEDAAVTDPLFIELEAIESTLAKMIVMRLPDYNAAPWG